MAVLKVLRARPELFFRLSGIRPADFDAPGCQLHPIWLAGETGRLSRKNRQRAIGGGRKYRLQLAEQMLLCLIPLYTTHAIFCLILGRCRKACSGWVRRSLPISSRPMRKMDFAYRP